MEVFINEKSLHGQYQPHSYHNVLTEYITLIKIINKLNCNKTIYISIDIYNVEIYEKKTLSSVLKSNYDLREGFTLNIKNATKWQYEQVHDSSIRYEHNKDYYTDTSVAEIAERKNKGTYPLGVLLNFHNSIFNTLCRIDVIKHDAEKIVIPIDCSYSITTIKEWLIANEMIDDGFQYDVNLKRAPFDYETILCSNDYEKTNYFVQGRKVYRLKGEHELWVVDNYHYGLSAEIEVFDERTGEHLGTSPYNKKELHPENKKAERRINL